MSALWRATRATPGANTALLKLSHCSAHCWKRSALQQVCPWRVTPKEEMQDWRVKAEADASASAPACIDWRGWAISAKGRVSLDAVMPGGTYPLNLGSLLSLLHEALSSAHTSYLSQTPQTCLCKNFLSGVNFSRLSEKMHIFDFFQRHF